MNYESLHTDFFTSFRTSIVNGNIQRDGNTVPVKATYNDEEDSPPAIVIEPVGLSEDDAYFGSGTGEEKAIDATITGQIFASTTLELDEITDQFKSAIPETVENFQRNTVDISYDFRQPNNQKIQSNTFSVNYTYN